MADEGDEKVTVTKEEWDAGPFGKVGTEFRIGAKKLTEGALVYDNLLLRAETEEPSREITDRLVARVRLLTQEVLRLYREKGGA